MPHSVASPSSSAYGLRATRWAADALSWHTGRRPASRLRSLFFFSSRRRHTRWPRDWSSDVCSSDLAFGARWLSGDGEGLYVSVHAAYIADRTQLNAIDYYAAERTVLGLTLGGRLRFWEGAFLDLGAGPGIQFRHEHSYYDAKAYERRFVRFGIVANMPLPDLELALGYEF